ncbi:unnamed protein product, partial [Mesorhabditis spiculigera]
MGTEMPGWLEGECDDCATVPTCEPGATTGADDRLVVTRPCRPNFCAADASAGSDTVDCILPVTINNGKDKVMFPFNLCTREMLAAGKCEGKAWSTAAYAKTGMVLTSQYLIIPSEFDDLQSRRKRRQAAEKLEYPRCIDISGLANEDRRRVEKDELLNCNKNIFVLFRTGDTSGLIINPPPCQGSNDSRICTNRHGTISSTPPIETTTAAALVSSEMLVWLGAGGGGVFLLIICGVLLSCMLKK